MEGDTNQENSLASELLHEVKATSKRWFILFIICLIMLFATNLAWLYAWNLPDEETTTEITSDNGSNANYVDGVGDIINGGINKSTQD